MSTHDNETSDIENYILKQEVSSLEGHALYNAHARACGFIIRGFTTKRRPDIKELHEFYLCCSFAGLLTG